MGGVGGGVVACRIIVSAPVPVPFLLTLDLGFGTWIWDLDLGLEFGTGLRLDNKPILNSGNIHSFDHFIVKHYLDAVYRRVLVDHTNLTGVGDDKAETQKDEAHVDTQQRLLGARPLLAQDQHCDASQAKVEEPCKYYRLK